jgi:hypothetical protein
MFFPVKVTSGLSTVERQIRESRISLEKDTKVLSELLVKLGKEIPRRDPEGKLQGTFLLVPKSMISMSSLSPIPGFVAIQALYRAGWVSEVEFTVSPGLQGEMSRESGMGWGNQKTPYVPDYPWVPNRQIIN